MNYEKKISICMMVKDEEKNLDRCLKSLLPILDSGLAELIIVDTGSKDNSIEIAKKYTNKVYQHSWTNDFSEMRNISISYARGEWIWIMDADEEIENPEEMIKLFQQDLSKYNTITVKMKNYLRNIKEVDNSKYSISILARGFRNIKGFKYDGSIHEQPRCSRPYLASNIVIGHYGYIWEDKEFTKKKFERNVELLRKELRKDPDNIYYQFQLAVSYAIVDKQEGLIQIRKAHKLIKKLNYRGRIKYNYIYGIYAKIAYDNNKYAETIKICQEGLSYIKDYIDLWFYLGLAYTQMNDDKNIVYAYEEFLKCRERFDKTILANDPAYTFYCLRDDLVDIALGSIVSVYVNKKEYKKALNYVNRMGFSEYKAKLVSTIAFEDENYHLITDYLKKVQENEDRKLEFIKALEDSSNTYERKMILADIIIKFYNANVEEPYYLLNLIRKNIDQDKKVSQEIFNRILKLDYNELEHYYGDILVYIIKNNLSFDVFRSLGRSKIIDRFIKYIIEIYKDIHDDIVCYLYKNENIDNPYDLTYWIVLARNILILEKVDEKCYEDLFRKYVDKGIKYIHKLYQPSILTEEKLDNINDDEHLFFLYLENANKFINKNLKEYVRYLRKALKIYPIMKKGIEILLEEIKEREEKKVRAQENLLNEFEEYKKIIKKNITILLEANKIAEVKAIIDEYLEIVPNDLEMLALKSEIQLKLM